MIFLVDYGNRRLIEIELCVAVVRCDLIISTWSNGGWAGDSFATAFEIIRIYRRNEQFVTDWLIFTDFAGRCLAVDCVSHLVHRSGRHGSVRRRVVGPFDVLLFRKKMKRNQFDRYKPDGILRRSTGEEESGSDDVNRLLLSPPTSVTRNGSVSLTNDQFCPVIWYRNLIQTCRNWVGTSLFIGSACFYLYLSPTHESTIIFPSRHGRACLGQSICVNVYSSPSLHRIIHTARRRSSESLAKIPTHHKRSTLFYRFIDAGSSFARAKTKSSNRTLEWINHNYNTKQQRSWSRNRWASLEKVHFHHIVNKVEIGDGPIFFVSRNSTFSQNLCIDWMEEKEALLDGVLNERCLWWGGGNKCSSTCMLQWILLMGRNRWRECKWRKGHSFVRRGLIETTQWWRGVQMLPMTSIGHGRRTQSVIVHRKMSGGRRSLHFHLWRHVNPNHLINARTIVPR